MGRSIPDIGSTLCHRINTLSLYLSTFTTVGIIYCIICFRGDGDEELSRSVMFLISKSDDGGADRKAWCDNMQPLWLYFRSKANLSLVFSFILWIHLFLLLLEYFFDILWIHLFFLLESEPRRMRPRRRVSRSAPVGI